MVCLDQFSHFISVQWHHLRFDGSSDPICGLNRSCVRSEFNNTDHKTPMGTSQKAPHWRLHLRDSRWCLDPQFNTRRSLVGFCTALAKTYPHPSQWASGVMNEETTKTDRSRGWVHCILQFAWDGLELAPFNYGLTQYYCGDFLPGSTSPSVHQCMRQ